jgi:hypothetical protein
VGLRERGEQGGYCCWTLGEAGRAARGAGATGFDRRFIEQTKFRDVIGYKAVEPASVSISFSEIFNARPFNSYPRRDLITRRKYLQRGGIMSNIN